MTLRITAPLRGIVAPALCWLVWMGLLCAQSPLATLTGTVVDSQKAGIPDADILVLNEATGLSFQSRSSSDGTYVAPNLPSGSYSVRATRDGFKAYQRKALKLEVSQRLRLDITLEVGVVTESITVNSEVSQVQTENSALGTVVEQARIENLPLNGRHVFNLMKLVAGVQPTNRSADGFADVSNGAISIVRFNGSPGRGNQIYVDGAMNTDVSHNQIAVVPMVDAVQEFRIETNSLKAEFGQTSGGVMNLVTKSGTNEWHGSLYEFLRNDSLDARNAFVTTRDAVTGRTKPVLRFNQYGGTFGGPVHIPKVYNGKNRTFFFAGYEQWKLRSSSINRASVPTAAQRNGDFTTSYDSTGAVIPVYDPSTTRAAASGGFVRDVFPGNVIPRERFDSAALNILKYMPLPNTTPQVALTNSNNFLSLVSSPVDQGVTTVRIDHRISDADSLSFRYSGTRNTSANKGYDLGAADSLGRTDQRDAHNAVATHTHIFSPRVINEFKASATRTYLNFKQDSAGQNWPSQLGLPSILPQDLFPSTRISGMMALGANANSTGIRAQHTIAASDSVSIIAGKHTIKAGFDQRWIRWNWRRLGFKSGDFAFDTGLTGNPQKPAGTGLGMASFLLGEVASGSQQFLPATAFQFWSHASYIQDDIKLTPRLTVNIGLRYDVASGPTERWNRYANFDPYVMNSATGRPGVLTYAGTTSPSNIIDRDKNNFGPRIGFAWDPRGNGKTAIRAGYGLMYLMAESNTTQSDPQGFASATQFVAPGLGPYRAFRLSEGPSSLVAPISSGAGSTALRGQNVVYQDRHTPTPYVQQWNFTVQQELPWLWTFSATYAGNRGVKLFGGNFDLNQIDPQFWALGLQLQNQVSNPYIGQITSGALAGSTISLSQSLRPYSDYLTVSSWGATAASSIYHSIQLTAQRRFSSGLSAMIAFTGSKLIDDAYSEVAGSQSGDFRIPRLNRRLDRSIDQTDIPKRIVSNVVWELPFGPGKRWASQTHRVVANAIGGWQVNGIYTIETQGVPLIIRGANNFTVNWPDAIRNPYLSPGDRSVTRWFDTDAIRNPTDFVLGNIPRTLPGTRGPGLYQLDMSAVKNFRILERAKAEFRFETFNLLNTVNLDSPNLSFSPNRQGVNTNALFGRITSSLPARRIQLGLRLSF